MLFVVTHQGEDHSKPYLAAVHLSDLLSFLNNILSLSWCVTGEDEVAIFDSLMAGMAFF